jgi:hypothetical protein
MYWRGTSKRFVLHFAAACLFFATLIICSPSPLRAQMATEDRLLFRGWWPRHSTASADQYVGPGECAKCHAGKAATQKSTPMALTAQPVAESTVLSKSNRLAFQNGKIGHGRFANFVGAVDLVVRGWSRRPIVSL